MMLDKPRGLGWIKAALLTASCLVAFAPQVALAQRTGARPIARPAPIGSSYRHPMPLRPIRPLIPRTMPVQRMMIPRLSSRPITLRSHRAMPIPQPIFRGVPPSEQASATVLDTHRFGVNPLAPRRFGVPRTFSRGSEWRGIGRLSYFDPYWFGNPYFSNIGYVGQSANYQMLPLGFGLWPACDSSAIPGRFWTIGPCAGIGDYAAATPSSENEYSQQPYYYELPPEFIVEQPQAAAPAAKKPSEPEKKPNMVIYLTDGRALAASDWWVTQGRFYFTTVTGQTETVDLPTLDLQKTIEQNEKQGLTFILNFTPPNERPVLPPLPAR